MQQPTVRERLSPKVFRDTRGFNVAELLTVVLIAGIMAGVSLPLVNTVIERNRLNGAAGKVASDLRYAQSLAVSRGSIFRLNATTADCPLQAGETRYRIEQDPPGPGVTPITECYLLSSEFQGVTLTSLTGTGGTPALTMVDFNSRGTCVNCTGNNPPLLVTVSSSFGTKTVQVRTTGSVDIQ